MTYFEIDFSWTSDNQLVLIHDWSREYVKWYKPSGAEKILRRLLGDSFPLSYAEFMDQRLQYDLTQLDLAGLMDWLEDHPNAKLVTDIKDHNLTGLRVIAETYPRLQGQIYPQIYQLSEYAPVIEMGYESVVFTGYRSGASIADIVEFDNSHNLFAVTLPVARLLPETLIELSQLRAPLWTHTIHDPVKASWLFKVGVSGFYTDFLLPKSDS